MVALFVMLLVGPVQLFETAPQKTLTPTAEEYSRTAITLADEETLRGLRHGDALSIPTPAGNRPYTVLRATSFLPGTWSITATADDGSGSHLALTVQGDHVTGIAQDFKEGRFERFGVDQATGQTYRAHVDHTKLDVLQCALAGDHTEHFHTASRTSTTTQRTIFAPQPADDPSQPRPTDLVNTLHKGGYSTTSDSVTIDLLIAYTPAAITYANGDGDLGSIASALAQMMNLSQQALDVSDIPIKLRLVHHGEVNYDESTAESQDHLDRLTAQAGEGSIWGISETDAALLDEVHTWRETYGADMVALVADIDDTGGLGWMISSHAGEPEYAFSINRIQQLHYTYTLIHEIGHNMGNAHGRTQTTSAATAKGALNPYSVGWRWKGANNAGYTTVMHYDEDGYTNETPYFSSATMLVDGVAIGAPGIDSTSADNARSMREIAFEVANYLPTRVGSPETIVLDQLNLTIPAGESITTHIPMQNVGNADMMWQINRVLDLQGPAFTIATNPTTRYTTGFEASEGFQISDAVIQQGWTVSPDASLVMIRGNNPFDGNQNLHFERRNNLGTGQTSWYKSPQFGLPVAGHHRVTLRFWQSSEEPFRFDLLFNDDTSQDWAGGAIVGDNGTVYTYRFYNGSLSFWTAGEMTSGIRYNEYNTLTYEIDPLNDQVIYRLNEGAAVSSAAFGASRINSLYFIPYNPSGSQAAMALDDVVIEQDYTYLPGLSFTKNEGTVPAGQSVEVPVSIDTQGIPEGTYGVTVRLHTNDGVKDVRINVNITTATSSDPIDQPNTITALLPAYPNPTPSETNVSWQLAQPEAVTVEVHDLLGRRVATLASGHHPAGTHTVRWLAGDTAPGVYVITLSTPSHTMTNMVSVTR